MNENNIKNKDIKIFVKELERTNTIVWNAVCEVENIIKSDVYKAYKSLFDEERIKFITKIAKAYNIIDHNDDSFAKPEMHESDFAEFEQFTTDLEEILDNLEN